MGNSLSSAPLSSIWRGFGHSNSNSNRDSDKMQYILGHGYVEPSDSDRMRSHVASLFRFTYRMNFEGFSSSSSSASSSSSSSASADPTSPSSSSSSPSPSPTAASTLSPSSNSFQSPSSINYFASSIGTDAGWGCMLRAGQMLLGHALLRHCLGKEWRYMDVKNGIENNYFNNSNSSSSSSSSSSSISGNDNDNNNNNNNNYLAMKAMHDRILKLFLDYPDPRCCFSIHNMVAAGSSPGEWCGPAKVSFILRDLCEKFRNNKNVSKGLDGNLAELRESEILSTIDALEKRLRNIVVHVTGGDTIYYAEIDDIMLAANSSRTEKLGSKSVEGEGEGEGNNSTTFFDPLLNVPAAAPKNWDNGLLLLVPLRLGINAVDEAYHKQIQNVLRHPNSVGILGGKVNHAIYFVGCNSDGYYLGLDPHVVYSTPSLDESFPTPELLSQVHVKSLEKLDMSQLDPSLTLGFYFATRNEFVDFYESEMIRAQQAAVAAASSGRGKGANSSTRRLFAIEKFAPSFEYTGYSSDLDEDTKSEDEDYVFV